MSQTSPVSRKKTPLQLVFFQIAVPLVALALSLGGTVSMWRVSLSHSRLQLLERFRAQTSEVIEPWLGARRDALLVNDLPGGGLDDHPLARCPQQEQTPRR